MLLNILEEILGKPRKKNINKQQYSFDCPTCSSEKGLSEGDGKGNLEINLNKFIYHCWVCGETHYTKGTLFKLIKKFGGKSYLEKIKKLGYEQEDFNVLNKNILIPDVKLPEEYIPFFSDNIKKTPEYRVALKYLLNRGLDENIIKKYNIGYTEKGKYSNRIIIPSYDEDGILNYYVTRTYINSKFNYINCDIIDKTSIIFNEQHINWNSTVYLVEGPFDHLVVPNSIPMLGKVLSDLLLHKIFTKAKSYIVILLDSDAHDDAHKIYNKLNISHLRDKIRIILFKKDSNMDISNINKIYGKEGVISVLYNNYELSEKLI
jgi:DNA primase